MSREYVESDADVADRFPILWAMDDAQSLFTESLYRAPDYSIVQSYNLSMPLLALDYITGRKVLVSLRFFSKPQSSCTAVHIRLQLLLTLVISWFSSLLELRRTPLIKSPTVPWYCPCLPLLQLTKLLPNSDIRTLSRFTHQQTRHTIYKA
jgi:hypothetical protein